FLKERTNPVLSLSCVPHTQPSLFCSRSSSCPEQSPLVFGRKITLSTNTPNRLMAITASLCCHSKLRPGCNRREHHVLGKFADRKDTGRNSRNRLFRQPKPSRPPDRLGTRLRHMRTAVRWPVRF